MWGISAWFGGGWCKELRQRRFTAKNQGILGSTTGWKDLSERLAFRLKAVRVMCGDWTRAVTDSMLFPAAGMSVAVFLDPPYSDTDRTGCYAEESYTVAKDVHQWAVANGDNSSMRIALCGHVGEHTMPDGWEIVEWRSIGARKVERKRIARECVWYSPHCLRPSRDPVLPWPGMGQRAKENIPSGIVLKCENNSGARG